MEVDFILKGTDVEMMKNIFDLMNVKFHFTHKFLNLRVNVFLNGWGCSAMEGLRRPEHRSSTLLHVMAYKNVKVYCTGSVQWLCRAA